MTEPKINATQERLTPSEDLNTVGKSEGLLAVSEIFGPTWQGEGASIGKWCVFLRLAGCNQHCVWCDTAYTWAFSEKLAQKHEDGVSFDVKQEVRRMSDDDIRVVLLGKGRVGHYLPMLVVSGGEPLLQQDRLVRLLSHSTFALTEVEIETAGTIAPTPELISLVTRFNVSPKLEGSKNELKTRYRPTVINTLMKTNKAVWKFVVTDLNDLQEVQHIVREHNLMPVYIMPEGRSADEIIEHGRLLAPYVLEMGWNFTTRLHVLMWGAKRGV
jgi:7-cyano-7-deazaguanosine (preQ0) biosynthesis protein QueE